MSVEFNKWISDSDNFLGSQDGDCTHISQSNNQWNVQHQPWELGNSIDLGYPNNTYYYYTWPHKSAREQVQDEILNKMAKAIEKDDLKKARELVKLAKALKEL